MGAQLEYIRVAYTFLACLAPICMLGRCLSTKFLHRSSGGSLSGVRCWLGRALGRTDLSIIRVWLYVRTRFALKHRFALLPAPPISIIVLVCLYFLYILDIFPHKIYYHVYPSTLYLKKEKKKTHMYAHWFFSSRKRGYVSFLKISPWKLHLSDSAMFFSFNLFLIYSLLQHHKK